MRPPHWHLAPQVPLPKLRSISRLWALAAVLSAAGVAALALDVPLAAWVARGTCPSIIQKLCGLSETFAHAAGIALLATVIAVLDPPHRFMVPRVVTAALGSGILANVFKLILARTRPHHVGLPADAMDTFAGWFPLAQNESWQQGFPSSHAATAAGLAIALSCLYPRGQWLFPAIAVLACAQRVLVSAHFLSDVLWGSAVGCIFAPLCVYGSGLSRAFDRLERNWMARAGVAISAVVPGRRSATVKPAASGADDVQAAA
ncbi:MAG: phosphatase PAP2 family protein [Pirellulales bacterium]